MMCVAVIREHVLALNYFSLQGGRGAHGRKMVGKVIGSFQNEKEDS